MSRASLLVALVIGAIAFIAVAFILLLLQATIQNLVILFIAAFVGLVALAAALFVEVRTTPRGE